MGSDKPDTDEPLDQWIERQYRYAATAMLRSISATGIVKPRPGFGQTIVPKKGSVVASPVLGAYDPDPDYFFHWFRDSAIIIDALRVLFLDGAIGPEAVAHFCDFVAFSLSLGDLSGRPLVGNPAWRENVAADFKQFLRNDADLGAVTPETVRAETRVNPDGALDISSWPRPQNDGPALRALTLLRWAETGADFGTEGAQALSTLIRGDLAFALQHWREPCFDIWEEENAHQYFASRVQAAALEAGAKWFAGQGEATGAKNYAEEAIKILDALDGFWLADEGFYRSRINENGPRSTKELDIAVILATIHSEGTGLTHSALDPKILATLVRLEALFDGQYPINKDRGPDRAPALGRYSGDTYYSGGAYYFSTLAAAELLFRRAAALRNEADPATIADLIRRGDAYLDTVRAFTPASGEMSEQFDRTNGTQTSAKHLAWSYAAFVTCITARRAVASTRKSGSNR